MFLGSEFDSREFVLDPQKLVSAAQAIGETRPEYVDPGHPDFQATPAFIGSLSAARHLPVNFPKLGGLPMDGGKSVTCIAPVRPSITLTGRSHLHEIYDKSGRSGRMIFIVSRMEIFDSDNRHVATSDARMVVRERPAS